MSLSVEEHVERLEVDGWTIVENAIDPALIDALDEALRDLEQLLGITPTANTFEGANTKRVFNLLAHDGPWPEVPTHPAIAPIIRGVLGEGFLISSLASVSIGRVTCSFKPNDITGRFETGQRVYKNQIRIRWEWDGPITTTTRTVPVVNALQI